MCIDVDPGSCKENSLIEKLSVCFIEPAQLLVALNVSLEVEFCGDKFQIVRIRVL